MRYKIIKIIISVFVALLCSIMFISAKYYVRTVQSFKTFYNETDVRLISMQNDSYNQLKKSIDEKYIAKFADLVNCTTSELKSEISRVLGNDYILLREEFYTALASIEGKRQEFNNSSEYLSAKEELSSVKSKIDSANDNQKDLYIDEFRVALNKVSTLNTKLNNQLKSECDKIEEIKLEVKKLFIKNAKELISLRKNLFDETKTKISSIIKEYTFEISELNSVYGVEYKIELPFDLIDFSKKGANSKLENECFEEILEKNVIFIENDSQILS